MASNRTARTSLGHPSFLLQGNKKTITVDDAVNCFVLSVIMIRFHRSLSETTFSLERKLYSVFGRDAFDLVMNLDFFFL